MFAVSTRRRALAVAAGAMMAGGMVLGAGTAQASGGPACGAWTDVGPNLSVRTCVEVHASSLEVWTDIQNSTDGNQGLSITQYGQHVPAMATTNGAVVAGSCYLVVAPGTQGLCGRFYAQRTAGFAQATADVKSEYVTLTTVYSPSVGT